MHALGGERVQRLAVELVLAAGHVAEHAHRLAVVRVGQAVVRHVVEELAAAVADAGARAVEQVRGVGHRLHAAGDHHLCRAGLDQVVAEHHRLHARAADLVDGGAAGGRRQPRAQRGLAGRGLAEAGRQHAAQDDLVDLVGGQPGLLQRALDRGGAQLGGGDAGELAEEGTDGGALGTDDDDVAHGDSGGLRKYGAEMQLVARDYRRGPEAGQT